MKRRPKLERMWKAIVRSQRRAGKSLKTAHRVASATVNKYRSKLARKKRGPKLVGKGGSRRQWYPGKGRHRGRR